MDYSDICKVIHTDILDQVNDYVSKGWKILAIATGEYEDCSPQHLYSLGLPKSADSRK